MLFKADCYKFDGSPHMDYKSRIAAFRLCYDLAQK
jgi:hypothetical protein